MNPIEIINKFLDKLYNSHQIIIKCNDLTLINIDVGELIYKTLIIAAIIYLADLIFILAKKVIRWLQIGLKTHWFYLI